MSANIGPRKRDDLEIEPRVSTWTSTVFEVRRKDRGIFVNVPEDDLEAFLESLEAGAYDATLRAALDSPPDVVLERLEQTDTIAVYGKLGDPTNLVPVERDPRTGKPLDGARARRDKRQHEDQKVRVPKPRSKVLVGTAIAVAVLAVAGIAVAATSGGSSAKPKAAPTGAQPGSGQIGAGGATGTPGTVGLTNAPALYRGFTTIRSQVLQSGSGYIDDGLGSRTIELDCSKAGCAMNIALWSRDGGIELTPREPVKGWSLRKTVTNPNGLFYQCIPSNPGVWTFDLHASGITQAYGIDVPARLSGTMTRKAPKRSNCPGIDAAYSLNAPLVVATEAPGGGPIVYG